ncbi:hypothetical protein O181_070694 [Austropuccinia psidii MF-1]|uniref:Reverse transcriptase domain-containing protein n=1 Tax=Austropuccinia psidii MF-1 TaxID=1389203 RepID=A0A9Q3I9R7_9BASI|nr:hypothetical protein [Austropuccinia psidii MF-1]
MDKNAKENSNNIKYKSEYVIKRCHICQSTTHLANTCPKKGKINEIDIDKEPDVAKDDVNEDNSDDKSSIFSEFSKYIENINYTFDIMESYYHFSQLRNGQLDLSRIQDAQTMKNKPNRGKSYTAEDFASDKEPLGAIFRHEVDIILNDERPYPPLLRRPAYPASPKAREALEIHIKELLNLGVIRTFGHNEEVEITTPVIVAWHNKKYRMVGDFRAPNTYTVPDRYPIPKIQIDLTQISKAVYINTMDSLKGFHKNVVTPRARKYLMMMVHCGVYEYLRMTFDIKNAPSHFQSMMNEIFPEELSEGWLIIYIYDIILCSKTWGEHIYRLSRVLSKIQSVNMKIFIKEIRGLGHVVSGLSLGIDKNKVAAVLLKPIPQNKKGIQSFLGFAGYFRKHIEDFASIARPLHKLCDKDTVFEMTVDRVKAFESLRQALNTAPLLLM